MRTIVAIVVTLALAGCEEPRQSYADWVVANAPAVRHKRLVEVISIPPGAHIEIGNQYIGQTPLSIELEATNDDRLSRRYIITALPSKPGQWTQTKDLARGETTPTRILFLMDLRTPPPPPVLLMEP